MSYAELHARTYFSFLDGACAPEDLVTRARELGYGALAVTDVDGLYGVPRAHAAARTLGLSLIIGAEVSVALTESEALLTPPSTRHPRLVLLAQDARGYARLCRILGAARLRHPKGSACATWEEVAHDTRGLVVLSGGRGGPVDRALAARDLGAARAWTHRLKDAFGERAYLELTHHLRPGDDERLTALTRLGRELVVPRVISQDARYARAETRQVHDVQTCIREKTTLATAGRRLEANGERHLHDLRELERRFAGFPDALERTVEIASRCRFSLESLRYRFPAFAVPPGETTFSYLYELVHQGARARYRPITSRVTAQLAHELGVIERLGLAGYFLIVWDIVRFCREQGILCQGRGSAANSAVCYALGITAVDPIGMDLLFERFISEDRAEMPDIDLDITHQRREETIQYVYARYGRDRAAMACEIISYRARSAIRDVGKAFGLSLAQVDAAAKAFDRWEIEADPRDGTSKERSTPEAALALAGIASDDNTVGHVLEMARAFSGFPRHLGIHSGGMVITEGPISEVVPIEPATMADRTVVQWDKDDLNALGIIKIDLLGLGMLTVLDDGLRLVEAHHGRRIDLAHVPSDDTGVYDMISRADTVGVFQIESRAQMSFLPRHKPRNFYDLVIEVAIIRPGPIQGEMIHPYLRRRLGQEPVEYAHPSLEPVLRRTLGVPLFQEQGMKLAIVSAGFTPGEADELRRAMGHKRSHERMAAIKQRLLDGMKKNGIPGEVGERIFKQLSAFADYGFPESHAASFALIVYASAYLKHYYPAAFCAALLNAQPMGFYAPHTIVSDAKRHGVEVRPPCARRSAWKTTLEGRGATEGGSPRDVAVRLGISSLHGAGEAYGTGFEAARALATFRSVGDFARRSSLPRAVIEKLATADGFACYGLARREALWQVSALPTQAQERAAPLLAEADFLPGASAELHEHELALPPMTAREKLAADFVGLGLSIDGNPIALARAALDAAGVLRAADLNAKGRDGTRAGVAGMVIVRQRPGTAKGMVFVTVEDETGLANLVFTPDVFERLRPVSRDEPHLVAWGKVEREGQVVNIKVDAVRRLREIEDQPSVRPRNFR